MSMMMIFFGVEEEGGGGGIFTTSCELKLFQVFCFWGPGG